ncbi:Bis(5'-nucleosyl)-tetraphosphatase [asymmetrical] [Chlamydiales bacterium STE3]|nr:Bis(5'-nucleosyl)-tetraphosphatase [asymmetrical] [Chlamydiales bacterium STE3]
MKKEASFGIVPLKRKDSSWEVLLVQPHQGWWGIPKGHPNAGESEKQTAERELFEETGLKVVKYLADEPLKEKYKFFMGKQLISKTVTYFLAEVEGTVVLQEQELKDYKWIDLKKASSVATYKETQAVLNKMQEWINA